jgi:hypothetical protein
MIIDYELFKGFERTLGEALIVGLALGEDRLKERCAAFLVENPEVVERRQTLSRDYERFEKALEELHNIPGLSLILRDGSDALMPETRLHTPYSEVGSLVMPVEEPRETFDAREMGFDHPDFPPSISDRF